MWFEQMHPDWQNAIAQYRSTLQHLENQLASATDLAPEPKLVMEAFRLSPSQIRVVILGQDPYPTKGVAVGRAFAVTKDSKLPASLRNIFKELATDLETNNQPSPDLQGWQDQGVLLINRHLTTSSESGPGAHFSEGWQEIIDGSLAHLLAQTGPPLALVLWGVQAQQVEKTVDLTTAQRPVFAVRSAHPSPLSARRGFFGSKPFSSINNWFKSLGEEPIDWLR